VLALQTDAGGALWIGTEAGAARFSEGKFQAIKETVGQSISSIIVAESNRVLMSSEQGQIFQSSIGVTGTSGSTIVGSAERAEPTITTRALFDRPLENADKDRPGPLVITSLNWTNNKLLAGTLGRGLVEIASGAARDVQTRPIAYFLYALETDKQGNLWVGTRTRKEEPGLYSGSESAKLLRNEAQTGAVMTIRT